VKHIEITVVGIAGVGITGVGIALVGIAGASPAAVLPDTMCVCVCIAHGADSCCEVHHKEKLGKVTESSRQRN